MENFQFFVPKGTRKSGKVENPNPVVTLHSHDNGKKPYRSIEFNKAAFALAGFEEGEANYIAVLEDNGVYFTVVSKEVVENNSGLFGRVGKNSKVVSVDIHDLVSTVGNDVTITTVGNGVFQFVPTTEVTNPETTTVAEAPVVEEEVVVDPFTEVEENVTEDFEF